MRHKLKWLAFLPGALFLTLAVLALFEQRWPGVIKSLLMSGFFFGIPFWWANQQEDLLEASRQ